MLFCFIFFLIFCTYSSKIFADEIEWLQASKTNHELLSINPNSIKYNNKGFLTFIAKQSVFDPDDQTVINNDLFLMVIDCENRLFSKFPANTYPKQVKEWDNPINNKLIKQVIVNSCAY